MVATRRVLTNRTIPRSQPETQANRSKSSATSAGADAGRSKGKICLLYSFLVALVFVFVSDHQGRRFQKLQVPSISSNNQEIQGDGNSNSNEDPPAKLATSPAVIKSISNNNKNNKKSQLPELDHKILNELMKEVNETETSLKILLNFTKHYTPSDGHSYGETITDPSAESERCKRYGFEYDPARKTRRRIFFGGDIADDYWHPILVHAAETYGLYHSVSFIESNVTTSSTPSPRKRRFEEGSLNLKVLQSGIFGPVDKVSVTVDFHIDNPKERNADVGGKEKDEGNTILVETMQREKILHRWKENGMTVDDIGIVSDTDEMFTRDFLLAAQTCDVPEFRLGQEQDCRRPKLIGRTLVFESSPECLEVDRIWYHPDMMIGECIDTIGDSNMHKPGEREYKGHGYRMPGYGRLSYQYEHMPNTTMFPLWKPVDFRQTEGGRMVGGNGKTKGNVKGKQDKGGGSYMEPTGFHLHNFFPSIDVLRWKYLTYTHPIDGADHIPLGKMHEDIDLTVNCVSERHDRRRVSGGYDAVAAIGPTPIVFQESVEYRMARQRELKEMVLKDEKKFGYHNSTATAKEA